MEYISHDVEDTLTVAERLSGGLLGGEVILLNGNLGSGKTVFTKGLARGLGIKDAVTSPTFVIFNVYEGGRLRLCHCDAYRLSGFEDAESTGISDFLGRTDTVCVVEWPANIIGLFEGMRVLSVDIEYIDEITRRIKIN